MAELDPLSGPVIRTAAPAPLQGQQTGYGVGALNAFTAAAAGSLSASFVARAVPGGPNNTFVPYDAAVKQFNDAGLDASVIPKGGLYQSGLDAIREQQTIINNASDAARRSTGAGGVGQFVASLAGGFADPLFLALGPLGRLAEAAGVAAGVARGAGLAARVATGGAEGAATMGAYTAATKRFGTAPGDADINSYTILHQTAVGMVFGGAVKGAFGERLDTGAVAKLERSDVVAKQQGISPNDVVSPTGAIGVHQVEPATARAIMGKDFDVSTLHDPEVNKMVADKILDENAARFPGDAEAQAIAYNAGPARAEEWIKAGRNDLVLPDETQKYVAHYRDIRDENPVEAAAALPPDVRDSAMKMAVTQMSEDSDVNVQPIIENGLAEKAQEVAAAPSAEGIAPQEPVRPEATNEPPPTPLVDALPKPGSANINERLSSAMLEQINSRVAEAAPTPDAEMENLKGQVTEAMKQAEHAHEMAFGVTEEGKSNAFKEAMAEEDEAGKLDGDLAKGIDAAVRCGVAKGFD